MTATLKSSAPLPVITRDGQAYVASVALERHAAVAIKRVPGKEGQNGFVACSASHCAPLKGVLTEGDTLMVPVAGLGDALGLIASFDDNRRRVTLGPMPRDAVTSSSAARVGGLAPNLRLTMLDGTTVTLDQLRGQRVLINSWASW